MMSLDAPGLAPTVLVQSETAARLHVVVSGAKPKGAVLGQVFADPASFKKLEGAVATFNIEPTPDGTVTAALGLAPGRYVIAVFQDTKGTGKLETNMLGKPTVPYGFSNNAGGRVGPPSFEQAAFDVGTENVTHAIELK